MSRNWKHYALAKPGAWRDEPWEGDEVAKVGDKIFVFFNQDAIGVKCGHREQADEWLARYPDSATKMAYIGKHGWNTLRLDGAIPDDDLADAIDFSYDAVVAKLSRSRRP